MLSTATTAATAFGIAGSATAATAYLGSLYTQQSVQSPWYARVRPAFAPPNWVFPVVWTFLYIALTAAFGLSILRDTGTVAILHILNLALNIAWCRTFFGKQELALALIILVGNLGVALAIAFATSSSIVRYLIVPYIAWLSFATALNVGAYRKNKTPS